jgi:hypothetical protein
VKENDKVYDEVTEADYEAIVRKRLKEEDFVVDDDGMGYADYGVEDWDNGGENNYSDDSDEDRHATQRRSASSGKDSSKVDQRRLFCFRVSGALSTDRRFIRTKAKERHQGVGCP